LSAISAKMAASIGHDTAASAVNIISQWWRNLATSLPQRDPAADDRRWRGSNGSRVRLWKRGLQKLASELGLDVVVSHLPPGISKWSKIEHRPYPSSARIGVPSLRSAIR
jgi:hypothetical protein